MNNALAAYKIHKNDSKRAIAGVYLTDAWGRLGALLEGPRQQLFELIGLSRLLEKAHKD